jgi:Glycosyl hydrolases family 43
MAEPSPPATSGWVVADHWSLRWAVRDRAGVEEYRRGLRMRRLRRTVVCAITLMLLVYGLVDDVRTQARLQARQLQLASTKSALADVTGLVTETEKLLRATISGRDADQAILDRLSAELQSDHISLDRATQALTAANLDIAMLDNCISGVQQAVSDIDGGDQPAAISAISDVASPCEDLEGDIPGGPVYPFDFPDPDVIDVSGTYFAYGTNSAEGNIQIITSSDLAHWRPVGNALPRLPAWGTPGFTWSPAVIDLDGRYLLYYAVDDGSLECISVAVASRPEGPFTDDSRAPLVCQRSLGGSIDPSPYTDGGSLYLTWKSNGASGQPSTIWAQELAPTGTSMEPGTQPTALLLPSQPWEGSVIEAPDMWVAGGTYYLFYSGNYWDSSSYAEGIAKCKGPLGPCSKPLDQPILSTQSSFVSPGGGSVFADSEGSPWIAFHAYLPDAVRYPNARLLFLRRLEFSGGIPHVEPPS